MGQLYLLHIEPPLVHARHYLGWTANDDVQIRVDRHLAGAGSPLIRAAVQAGRQVTLVKTWPGTRDEERRLKRRGSSHRHCPLCRPDHLAARRARRAAR